jgi:hypothetical protein
MRKNYFALFTIYFRELNPGQNTALHGTPPGAGHEFGI